MNNIVKKNIEEWSNHPFCEETQDKLNHLKNDKFKLSDAFYRNLEFGTNSMLPLNFYLGDLIDDLIANKIENSCTWLK